MNVPNITLPDLQLLFKNNSILNIIITLFITLLNAFSAIVDGVIQFTDVLMETNDYVINMASSIESGTAGNFPIAEFIGAYRFLVGDNLFRLTYLSVVIGCFFTLYKLFLIVYRRYRETKTEITVGGNSISSLTDRFTNFLK